MSRKDALVDQVVSDVLRRRGSGEAVSNDRIIAEHGELEPELREALSLLTALNQVSTKACDAHSISPISPLTDEELDLPLGMARTDGCAPAISSLRIDGYTVLREIDRGGQAAVYEAFHHLIGRRVAIKVLTGGRFASDRSRARFEREALILAKLDHPGIVCILDRGQTADGFFFIVMPLVDGPPLDDYLANGSLSVPKICALFAGICRAVAVAHRLGVIHRDLKPSNVRVDRHGHPRVLDFGLAQLLDPDSNRVMTLTAERHVVGSTPYSSPEQVMAKHELDGRSDIYSLGLMLYEAIAGKPVFARDLPLNEMLRHILMVTPPRPSGRRQCRGSADSDVDAVILRCLAKLPEFRYDSADGLADDLDAVANGRPVKIPVSRTRKLPALVSVFLLATVAFAALGNVFTRSTAGVAVQRSHPVDLPQFRNSVGMVMLHIPAGEMLERGAGVERVDTDFWLASTDVTRGEYATVMQQPLIHRLSELPINNVSWFDAAEFCRRLSLREHRRYRLPTALEWEYACRAADRPIALPAEQLSKTAWSSANSGGHVHPVASLQPNAWGLYDMLGNVAEWCNVGEGERAATLGGAFDSPSTTCRPDQVRYQVRKMTSPQVGFRIVAEK